MVGGVQLRERTFESSVIVHLLRTESSQTVGGEKFALHIFQGSLCLLTLGGAERESHGDDLIGAQSYVERVNRIHVMAALLVEELKLEPLLCSFSSGNVLTSVFIELAAKPF